jgi:hypothetical protein
MSGDALSNPAHAPLLPPNWRTLTTTCGYCGAPQTCCSQGRGRGATGHGEPAEGREGGDAAGCAPEAQGGAQTVWSELR